MHLCEAYGKDLTNTLIDTFFEVLKKYPFKVVSEAGYRCLEDLEFFPRPAQLIKLMPKTKGLRAAKDLQERYTCPACKNLTHAIIEGKCWDCHTGIPLQYGREPSKQKDWIEERDWIISDNMQCQACKMPNLYCIKEPIDSGQWRCQKCYTGLTMDQYKQKLRDIIAIAFQDRFNLKDVATEDIPL